MRASLEAALSVVSGAVRRLVPPIFW